MPMPINLIRGSSNPLVHYTPRQQWNRKDKRDTAAITNMILPCIATLLSSLNKNSGFRFISMIGVPWYTKVSFAPRWPPFTTETDHSFLESFLVYLNVGLKYCNKTTIFINLFVRTMICKRCNGAVGKFARKVYIEHGIEEQSLL